MICKYVDVKSGSCYHGVHFSAAASECAAFKFLAASRKFSLMRFARVCSCQAPFADRPAQRGFQCRRETSMIQRLWRRLPSLDQTSGSRVDPAKTE